MLNQKLNQKILWVSLACLMLLTTSPASAEMSNTHSQHNNNNQFQIIQQPLGLKVAVTIAGLGLIGLELWWFIFTKSKA
jgi:plastocyanin domain-containing protein